MVAALVVGAAGASPAWCGELGANLHDFTGKGSIQVSVPGNSLTIGFEQAYVAPDAYYFSFDLNLIRQWSLAVGNRERTYGAGEPFAVEKQYRNLDRVATNPTLAAQLSMAEMGHIIADVETVQNLGIEKIVDQECSIVRFSNKELLGVLHAKGLVGDEAAQFLEKGITKAWLIRNCALPARIEIGDSEGNPAIVYSFSEVKVNTGLKSTDLRIPIPRGIVMITVSPDVTVPKWEEICDAEIKKQVLVYEKQAQQQQLPIRRGRP
jgi:hypothetical protein